MLKLSSFFSRPWLYFAFLCLFPLFSGCHAPEGIRTTMLPEGKVALSRLAVLPFQAIVPDDPDARMVPCPLCESVFQTEKSARDVEKILEDILLDRLGEYPQFTLILPPAAGATYRSLAAAPRAPLTEIVQKTGKELGADGVLVGYVFRYRERKGRSYSVEKPASVAFELHLIRVSDGVTVWRSSFDRTQTSFMENLSQLSYFSKWGIKWLTARELAIEGVEEVLKTFPGITGPQR